MSEKNYILSEEEFGALMGLRDLANGLVLGYNKREQEQSAQESFCFMLAQYLDLLEEVVRVVDSKHLIIKRDEND